MTPEPTAAAPPRGRDDQGWSEPRVARLKQLWGDGLSAAEVAARLGGGVTRNAVLGKIHRLGLCRHAPAAPRRAAALAPAKPMQPRGRQPAPLVPRARPARGAAPVPPLAGLVPRLEDLAPHMCHWPIGDPRDPVFAFCGRVVEADPYCPAHRACAYRGLVNLAEAAG
jgi:GcrA cell cycle regulator